MPLSFRYENLSRLPPLIDNRVLPPASETLASQIYSRLKTANFPEKQINMTTSDDDSKAAIMSALSRLNSFANDGESSARKRKGAEIGSTSCDGVAVGHIHPNQLHKKQQQYSFLPSSPKIMRQQIPQQQQNVDSLSSSLYRRPITPPTSSNAPFPMGTTAGTHSNNPEHHKKNHSAIEKRRRDKMNTHINELASIIPTCASSARKMDKLTVLRLALQHMRSLRTGGTGSGGDVVGGTDQETCTRPTQLTDGELKRLILSSSGSSSMMGDPRLELPITDNCFLFVVDSARGRILYVSQSVGQVLGYLQSDLFGKSLFDILHPKDVAKVKEQMSSLDQSAGAPVRERLIDSKTMLPVGTLKDGNMIIDGDIPVGRLPSYSGGSSSPRFCPGTRRSFFCRMKTKTGGSNRSGNFRDHHSVSSNSDLNSTAASLDESAVSNGSRRKGAAAYGSGSNSERRYRIVQCTGYLRSWASNRVGIHDDLDSHGIDSTDLFLGRNSTVTGSVASAALQNADSALSCLVAIGRIIPPLDGPLGDLDTSNERIIKGGEFTARHTTDGRFSFVDQRAAILIGYLPHELVGTSVYEHIQYDDIPGVSNAHRSALIGTDDKRDSDDEHVQNDGNVRFGPFRFRCKDGSFLSLKGSWRQFRNPWTKEIEYIVAKYLLCIPNQSSIVKVNHGRVDQVSSSTSTNTPSLMEGLPTTTDKKIISTPFCVTDTSSCLETTRIFSPAPTDTRNTIVPASPMSVFGKDIQGAISSHAEASKIGLQIAHEVMKHEDARDLIESQTEVSMAQQSNSTIISNKNSMVELLLMRQRSQQGKNTTSSHSVNQLDVNTPTIFSSPLDSAIDAINSETSNCLLPETLDIEECLSSATEGNVHSDIVEGGWSNSANVPLSSIPASSQGSLSVRTRFEPISKNHNGSNTSLPKLQTQRERSLSSSLAASTSNSSNNVVSEQGYDGLSTPNYPALKITCSTATASATIQRNVQIQPQKRNNEQVSSEEIIPRHSVLHSQNKVIQTTLSPDTLFENDLAGGSNIRRRHHHHHRHSSGSGYSNRPKQFQYQKTEKKLQNERARNILTNQPKLTQISTEEPITGQSSLVHLSRSGNPHAVSPNPDSSEGGDANEDEAAMAVIMSLLEADGGLGDSVGQSDLSWPELS